MVKPEFSVVFHILPEINPLIAKRNYNQLGAYAGAALALCGGGAWS